MLAVGDIYIYATDFPLALRFWADGLGLRVVERETTPASGYALLRFPSGGPAVRLFGGAAPWPEGERPEVGTRPAIRFDILASDFEATLVRLLEHGGEQEGEIEEYGGLRVVTVSDPDGNSFELLEAPEHGESAGGD